MRSYESYKAISLYEKKRVQEFYANFEIFQKLIDLFQD